MPRARARQLRPQHARGGVVAALGPLLLAEVVAHLLTLGPVLGPCLAVVSVSSIVVLVANRWRGWLGAAGTDQLTSVIVLVNTVGPLIATGDAPAALPLLATIVCAGGLLPAGSAANCWVLSGSAAGAASAVLAIGGTEGTRLVVPFLVAAALALAISSSRARAQRVATTQIAALRAAQVATATSERAYRELFNRSPVGIGVLDDRAVVTAANEALCLATGRTSEQLVGRPVTEVLGGAAVEGAEPQPLLWGRRVLTRPDGSTRHVEVSTSTGAPTAATRDPMVVHVRDVTEQVQAEEAARRARADLTAVAAVVRRMSSGQDGRTAVVDATRDIAGANTACLLEPDGCDLVVTAQSGQELLGVRVSMESVSVTAEVWRTGEPVFLADPAEHPLVSPALLALSGARSMMWQPVTCGGQMQAVLAVTWPTRISGLDDRAAQAVALLAAEAATALERELLLASLRDLATTDPLTGLANRRCWDQALGAALDRARRAGTSLSVAILDLDYFKAYNDTYGHNAGDELLSSFGQGAAAAVRDIDLVARWGGEEFAVLLDGCSDGGTAAIVVERVRLTVPAPVTCSAGLAVWDGAETSEQLMARADASLYRAKGAGRDRTAISPLLGPADLRL